MILSVGTLMFSPSFYPIFSLSYLPTRGHLFFFNLSITTLRVFAGRLIDICLGVLTHYIN